MYFSFHHYLFKFTGDKTVQCGRKPDVLKLWLQWKAIGDEGMEERVDKAFENAKLVTGIIRQGH